MLPNSIQYVVGYYAAARIGVIASGQSRRSRRSRRSPSSGSRKPEAIEWGVGPVTRLTPILDALAQIEVPP